MTAQLTAKIQQLKEAGLSDNFIYDKIQQDERFLPLFQQLSEAGLTSDDVKKRLFPKHEEEIREGLLTPGQEARFGREFEATQQQKQPGGPTSFREAYELLEPFESDNIGVEAQSPRQAGISGRAFTSGATLGLSENIPGMGFSEEEREAAGPSITAGEVAGTLLPIEGMVNLYGKGTQLALKSLPFGVPALNGLTRIISAGLTGATIEGLEKTFHGEKPSFEDIAQHGLMWSALDAGLGTLGLLGRFGKNLVQRARGVKKPSWKVVNDSLKAAEKLGIDMRNPEAVAVAAFTDLEKSIEGAPKTFKPKTEVKPKEAPKVTPAEGTKDIPRIEPTPEAREAKLFKERVKPIKNAPLREPTPFIPEKVAQEAYEYAPRYQDKKTFGEAVKGHIEVAAEEAKESYEALYKSVKPVASKIDFVARETDQLIIQSLNELKKFKTMPTGFSKASKDLVNSLEDLGYEIKLRKDGGIKSITPPQSTKLSVDEAFDLSRRLSEMADYEELERSVKKVFNRASKSLKEEAKQQLRAANTEAYKAFEKAEREFEQFAQKKTDAIQKIRRLEETEKVADLIQKPSVLSDLKNIMSPEGFKEVEREIFEHIADMEPKKAQKTLREIQNYMSKEGRKIAKDLIEEKFLKEFADSIIKDGKVDTKKAKEAMQSMNTRRIIEEVGGKDAVRFFENIENYEKQAQANLNQSIKEAAIRERIPGKLKPKEAERGKELLTRPAERRARQQAAREGEAAKEAAVRERIPGEQFAKGKEGVPPTPRESVIGKERLQQAARARHPWKFFIEDAAKNLGIRQKSLLSYMLGSAFGVKGLGAVAGYKITSRLANNPKIRRSYIDAVKTARKGPTKFLQAVNATSKLIEEEEED